MGRHRHNEEPAPAPAQGRDDEESLDPRLVSLLQYFRELYVEKREIFKKIFPEEFGHDMLKKIGAVLPRDRHRKAAAGGGDRDHRNDDGDDKVNFRTRSLSMDSPRTAAGKGGAEDPVRMERFKVKTFDVKGGGQGGGGGQGSGGGQGGQGGGA